MKLRSSPSSHKRMAVDHNAQKSLFLGALYCNDDEGKTEVVTLNKNEFAKHTSLVMVCEHDFCWDDEELRSLFIKERETSLKSNLISETARFLVARKQALEFVLRISSYHGFSTSAIIAAVNFVDRFLLDYVSFERERPWLMQLVAVSCLSLAAKVEETHVPLLVDLQVEDEKYLFDSKTIQRMELLILSALKWRMNPVTPLSFIDHIVRRLAFKSHAIRLEFLRICGNIILSIILDSRSVGYFPSVLATATMLHVVNEFEYFGSAVECENAMLDVLKISKEEVEECYRVILDVISSRDKNGLKRKILEFSRSSSSSGAIIDDTITNSDTSNDSSSSPRQHPNFKKTKLDPQHIN